MNMGIFVEMLCASFWKLSKKTLLRLFLYPHVWNANVKAGAGAVSEKEPGSLSLSWLRVTHRVTEQSPALDCLPVCSCKTRMSFLM